MNARLDYAREGLICEIETLLEENKLEAIGIANLEVTKLVEND